MTSKEHAMQQVLEFLKTLPIDDVSNWHPGLTGFSYEGREDVKISFYFDTMSATITVLGKEANTKNDFRITAYNQSILRKFSIEQKLYNYCRGIQNLFIEKAKVARREIELELEQRKKENEIRKYKEISEIIEKIG